MFSILIIIFSFKVINYFINYVNYNKNNNISHTGINPSATWALGLPSTQEATQALQVGQTAHRVAVAWGAASGHGMPSA
jgi:hypothetical protein